MSNEPEPRPIVFTAGELSALHASRSSLGMFNKILAKILPNDEDELDALARSWGMIKGNFSIEDKSRCLRVFMAGYLDDGNDVDEVSHLDDPDLTPAYHQLGVRYSGIMTVRDPKESRIRDNFTLYRVSKGPLIAVGGGVIVHQKQRLVEDFLPLSEELRNMLTGRFSGATFSSIADEEVISMDRYEGLAPRAVVKGEKLMEFERLLLKIQSADPLK